MTSICHGASCSCQKDTPCCRGFTNPLKKLYRQIFPRSYLAREFSSRLANLHSLWHKIMMDVLVTGAAACKKLCIRIPLAFLTTGMDVVLPWSFASLAPSGHTLKRQLDLQARGKVMEDDTSLWGCLSRVTDLKTGQVLLLHLMHFSFVLWTSNRKNACLFYYTCQNELQGSRSLGICCKRRLQALF